MSRVRVRRASALLAAGLLVVACTESSDETVERTTTSAPSAGSTTEAVNEWALEYTGGSAGAADPSLEPVVVGYVNQEGGVPAFPEATAATEAAVEYINAELGGIGGHPLELKHCSVQAEEDGQRCGTEMVNDSRVNLVLTGAMFSGGASLYEVVAPGLPVIVGNPLSFADFVTPGLVAFTPGGPGVFEGIAVFIATELNTPEDPAESVAIVYEDNEVGQASFELLLKPALDQLGITEVRAVPVSGSATAPDLQAALQAANAAQADVIVPIVTLPLCIATYDALKALGVEPVVITTGLCSSTPMTQHLADIGESGEAPDGWYFGNYGYSFYLPDEESGMDTYIAKVTQYAGADVQYTGFAGPQFGNVLTIAKFLNTIGPDAITPDAIRAQIDAFEGPMMMVAGPMACGEVSPILVALCGAEMGVEQYVDGEWVPVAMANVGRSINPGRVLAAS